MGAVLTRLGLASTALILLLFAPTPARGNNCPVFSWPNSADIIKVTYGKCPLVPATATITANGGPFDHAQWEIVALYPFNPGACPAKIVPMPAWISFEPSSGSSTGAVSIKMTIDPTKGGGSVTLGFFESDQAVCSGNSGLLGVDFPGGAVAPNWFDQNGVQFIRDGPNGTFAYGFGTWIVSTDAPSVSPGSTSLDLGPSCPRSGGRSHVRLTHQSHQWKYICTGR